jgi:hypothetical protein
MYLVRLTFLDMEVGVAPAGRAEVFHLWKVLFFGTSFFLSPGFLYPARCLSELRSMSRHSHLDYRESKIAASLRISADSSDDATLFTTVPVGTAMPEKEHICKRTWLAGILE